MKQQLKRLCPFIKSAFKECHASKMDSQHVEDAIYYCGGHFEECPLYLKFVIGLGGAATMAEPEMTS